MLKLEFAHSNILLSQPESGMGYQIVEATLNNYEKQRCIVYNAELLIFKYEISDIKKNESYNLLLEKSNSSSDKIIDLKVVAKSYNYISEVKGANESQIEYTVEDEVFKRFSAFKNDKRITDKYGLYPGTYATTKEDAEHVNTGMDAVARYALPNIEPAIYVFTIKPTKNTEIQRGIVQPANNQPGGGVEIIFTKGSDDNTVSGPDTIPANENKTKQ